MMKKVQTRLFFLVFWVLISSGDVIAQDDLRRSERRAIAEQSIKQLKEGTLVLRLKSKRNKIREMKKVIAAPDIKPALRKRLEKRLENTIKERDRYNQSLIDAFDEYYSFSNIYYIYDSSSVELKNGERSGIFLDKNREVDPTIEIPEGDVFVLRTGNTDYSSTTGIEALVVMNKELKDLQRPFPYYVRVHSIGRLFTRIFNPRKLVLKDSKAIVQKLDANLNRYLDKVR